MNAPEMLVDAFGRINEVVREVAGGLTVEQLAARVDPEANSIGWLLWHLTRVQDDHLAEALGSEQLWYGGWADRFELPYDDAEIGYGHTSQQVGLWSGPTAELLIGYHGVVHASTVEHLQGLTDADLERVVDERWDPPVTLGVRLVSVVADDLQHCGHAAYVRGLLERA